MDPEANREEALDLARTLVKADEYADTVALLEQSQRLAELVIAQDEWLSKGGFKPAAWSTSSTSEGCTCGEAYGRRLPAATRCIYCRRGARRRR